jgi:hypothetical protein
MVKKFKHTAKYEKQFYKTKENKIRKLKKQLEKNPNNVSVRKALEFLGIE